MKLLPLSLENAGHSCFVPLRLGGFIQLLNLVVGFGCSDYLPQSKTFDSNGAHGPRLSAPLSLTSIGPDPSTHLAGGLCKSCGNLTVSVGSASAEPLRIVNVRSVLASRHKASTLLPASVSRKRTLPRRRLAWSRRTWIKRRCQCQMDS